MSRSGRRQSAIEEFSIEGSELNLVPYMDIMTNLVMFMLFTYQVVVEMKLIQFNPPAASSQGAGADANPDKQQVMLTVGLTKDGFRILTTDANMGSETVPLKGNGDYDFEELSKRLARIKFESGLTIDPHLIVVAEPSIVYDKVVQTLDATRETKDGKELFPEVTLGMAMGG